MEYIWLLLGLALLFFGGNWLVKGSVALALRFKVSSLVIGLTVMAFATSAPELLVSLEAALAGHPDIALGNVIGSNIANLGLILGIVAIGYKMPASIQAYRFDWIVMMASTLGLYIILKTRNEVGFIGGFTLVAALITYNVYKIKKSRNETIAALEDEIDPALKKVPLWKTVGFLLLGIVAMRYGASFFVEGASAIALTLGVSERVISVSVVAVGTSIPELVASLIAAQKGEKDMALGNLIGSNIFNILAVLGITALVTPIPVQDPKLLQVDYWWMLAFALVLAPLIKIGKQNVIGRTEGFVLFFAYASYIVLQYL